MQFNTDKKNYKAKIKNENYILNNTVRNWDLIPSKLKWYIAFTQFIFLCFIWLRWLSRDVCHDGYLQALFTNYGCVWRCTSTIRNWKELKVRNITRLLCSELLRSIKNVRRRTAMYFYNKLFKGVRKITDLSKGKFVQKQVWGYVCMCMVQVLRLLSKSSCVKMFPNEGCLDFRLTSK